MGVVVTFNYATWTARYPELADRVNATLAQLYFNEATIYHKNDGTGSITDPTIQLTLLNMVTAHIAALYAAHSDGQDNERLKMVGRISSAAEGSVNVSADLQGTPGSAQWWQQTQYGASYWQATTAYRTMRYHRQRGRNFNPFPFALFLICLLAAAATSARPPANATHEFQQWFESLRNPVTGGVCCGEADGKILADDEWRVVGDHYEVKVEGKFIPVPPGAILNRVDNPTGAPVLFMLGSQVLCFVRATET